jgi:2-(1,2-epoxy-1,2-dihydrophenyl)acetyl-CoA isomerase
MTYTQITLDKAGRAATLTLRQPDKLNAVSRKMIGEIKAGLGGHRRRRLGAAGAADRRAAVSAPAPISPIPTDNSPTADGGSALEKFFNPVIRSMRSLPKPIVAAVNGVAAGVGMSFALASDIAIAAKSASFLQAFARIGLLPDGGSTWFLPRLVGEQRARALTMLAPQIKAEQARNGA